MVSEKVIIRDGSGLHLRPAGIFCKVAMKYECHISFSTKNTIANAKSVLSILGACVKNGDEIEITCDGVDEEEALHNLVEAASMGFIEYDRLD